MRGYVVVEGHGETDAIQNLLTRLWHDLGLPYNAHWATPIRWNSLHRQDKLRAACNLIRGKGDADMLLILRDADLEDDCPKFRGPEAATWLKDENLPFPVAVTLFHQEYETLFLASLPSLIGKDWRDDRGNARSGFPTPTSYEGDPEAIRGVKEWLSKQLPSGRGYKPTLDQLPLTRLLDFCLLRQSALPCFGTLERSLRFLAEHQGCAGNVYPVP